MNTRVLLSNLREAEEELRSLIKQLEKPESLPFEDFHSSLAHAYHHLNTAWNARNVSQEQWVNQTDEDYERWESYPVDLWQIGSDEYYDLPEYREAQEGEPGDAV